MNAVTFDPMFEPERERRWPAVVGWIAGIAVVLALAWFVYTQLTANGIGIAVPAPSPQEVSMLPPPPPPPPPPPEPEEKPPEPTEQAQQPQQPTPADAAKPEPAKAPAPMSMDAPAQSATPDGYGVMSGPGGGRGKPGVCLTPPCGNGPVGRPVGNGMTVGMYGNYLNSVLQERVQNDPKLGRLIFSADFSLTVTADGRVTGVVLRSSRGGSDSDMARLRGLLAAVRGLNPPPAAMVFPQIVTVRGRKSAF